MMSVVSFPLLSVLNQELKPDADLVLDDIECFVEDLDANFDGRVSWSEYLASLQEQEFDVPLTDLGE